MHQLSLLFIIVVISGALCTVQDFVIMSKCARNKAIHIAHDGKVSVTDILPMTQNITIAGTTDILTTKGFRLTLFAKETQMFLCFNNHWRLVGMKKLHERCYFTESIKYGYFEFHSLLDVKRRIGFTHRGKPVGPRKNVEDECYSFTKVEGKKFFSTQPTSSSLIAATSAGSHNSHKNRNHNNNNKNNNNNNNNNGHSNSYSNSGSNNSRNRNNSNNSNNINNNNNNNNNNLISANKHNNAHQHHVRHHHNDPNVVAKRQSHATGRRLNNNNNYNNNNNNNSNNNNNNNNNKRKLCNRSNLLNTNQTTAATLTTQIAVVDKDSVVTPVVRKQRKIKIKCGNRGQRARFLNPKDPEHRRIVFSQQQQEQQQLQQLQLQSTQSSTQQQQDYTQDLSSTSPTFQDSYTTSNGESGSGSFSSIPDEYSNDDASAILPDLPNSLDSSTEYLNDSNNYSSDKQINTTNIYLNSDDTDNTNNNSNINTVTVTITVTLTNNDLSTNISKNSTNNVSSDVNVTNINKNNNNNNNNYYNNNKNNNNNNNSNYNKKINNSSMLDSQTTAATATSSLSSSISSVSSPSSASSSSASSSSSTTTTTTLKKYYKKSKPIIISASFQSIVGDQRDPLPVLGFGLRDLKVNDNNLTPTNNLDKTTKTSYNDKTLPLRRKLTTVGS